MALRLRTLGVRGVNAPLKASLTVRAAEFNKAGLVGFFERQYDRAFLVRNPSEQQEIFGNQIDSSAYGPDCMSGFWNNLAGARGEAYIKAHVGFNGTAIDAVVASSNITDLEGLDSIRALMADIDTAYSAHDADAELGVGWAFHAAQEVADHSFPSPMDDSSLGTIISTLNSWKTLYNAHDADATCHAVGGSHPVSAANATNIATAVTLINAIKAAYNSHRIDAAQHTSGADNVNTVTVANAASTAATTIKAEAGYKALDTVNGADEYGTSGNRTGYTIESGNRFTTQPNVAVAAPDTSAVLKSVSDIKVGDIVYFAAPQVYKKVTKVTESTNTIEWSGAIGGTAGTTTYVYVPGFKIRTWRKSINGIVSEVETELGRQWCTMEPEVTDYYLENVHEQNRYLKLSDQSSASVLYESFPDEIPTVVYLTGGAAGTTPSTTAHWSRDLSKLDNLPIRMLALCETSDQTIQKSVEVYSKNRRDNPIVFPVIAEDRTQAQLETIGSQYQRSDDVIQVNVADWCLVDDPFNTAPNAPDRSIPNVGHVMGAWVRSITQLGIHYIPCVDQVSIIGINGVNNGNLGDVDDIARTNLAEYGINIIQFISGAGYRIRNFFTPSTTIGYQFANGIIMRNYIKVSSEDSLRSDENTPNSFNRIKANRDAIKIFLYRLWDKGSTGSVPVGETFGQEELEDGSLTGPEDHFEVQADAINNPRASVQAGERTITVYFTYPSPAGSIEIQAGILLK